MSNIISVSAAHHVLKSVTALNSREAEVVVRGGPGSHPAAALSGYIACLEGLRSDLSEVNAQIAEIPTMPVAVKGNRRGKVILIFEAHDHDLNSAESDESSDGVNAVTFDLSYAAVDGVKFRSVYELHACMEGEKPSSSVSFHYRVRVSQSTGENWFRTSLVLSKPRRDTSYGTTTPPLIGLLLSIPGKTTIPSDGVEHEVSVAVLPLEAKISFQTFPRLVPVVHFHCEVRNTRKYTLPPGTMNALLDGIFVAKEYISVTDIGDTFTCSLGDDLHFRVDYSRYYTHKPDLGVSSITTCKSHISICNDHSFDISELVVREVMPQAYAWNNKMKVTLKVPNPQSEVEDTAMEAESEGDTMNAYWRPGSDGLIKWGGNKEWDWRCVVAKYASVALKAEWDVEVPVGSEWSEYVQGKGYSFSYVLHEAPPPFDSASTF